MAVDTGELVGRRFGRLTVVKFLGAQGKSKYLCKCDCGNETVALRERLLNGRHKTCCNCDRISHESGYCRYTKFNGDSFIFDECDLDIVSKYHWQINSQGYVSTHSGGKSTVLTRMIMNPTDEERVDHIDGNPRNNRRSNLRIASVQENQRNMALAKHNTSGYKGVGYRKDRGKYRAYISLDNNTKHIGYFDTPEEAARAYDEAARFYFGEFACLNFPEEGERGCRPAEVFPLFDVYEDFEDLDAVI